MTFPIPSKPQNEKLQHVLFSMKSVLRAQPGMIEINSSSSSLLCQPYLLTCKALLEPRQLTIFSEFSEPILIGSNS